MLLSSLVPLSTALRASTSRLRTIPTASPRLRLRPLLRPAPVAQCRCAHALLTDLQPAKGSTKKPRRIGRGPGSKMGGHTVGRGHKGQRSRAGKRQPYVGFEGGQTRMLMRIPKHGFVNFTRKTYAPLPIERLQSWIHQGRIDPSEPITVRTAVKSNVIHGIGKFNGVKLLGDVNKSLPLPPLTIHLSRFSKSAGQAILDAGGSCLAVYHNRLSLMQELRPQKFEDKKVKMARPTRRNDILYYTDPEKFGYLADVKEEFFRERGFNPEIKRSKIAGQPYVDTRGLEPDEAALRDTAQAQRRMDRVLEIGG